MGSSVYEYNNIGNMKTELEDGNYEGMISKLAKGSID